MEIKIDSAESKSYYGEVLAVMSNYLKLVENPRQKVRGLDSQAMLLTGIAAVFLVIFAVLFMLDSGNTLYLFVVIIFLIALLLGIIYNLLVFRRISKLKNNDPNKKLVIEDEYVELHIGDERFRLDLKDIHWIILNKYSITFLPKIEGASLIAISIKYKSQVIDNIEDKSLIVDNSNLY